MLYAAKLNYDVVCESKEIIVSLSTNVNNTF